ncbi:unnamed protein product [Calypogeia fissa]
MASTVIATMSSSSPMLGGLTRLPASTKVSSKGFSYAVPSLRTHHRSLQVRAADVSDKVTEVRETVDKATKKEITKDEILRNQQTNESEKKSVFGAKPDTSSSLYPRPEVERRPETGDRDLGSIFAFDGALPETVNGRLAMVGMVWSFIAERTSGLTVFDQLYKEGTGLVYYLAIVQIITFISLIPFFKGESTDARSFGPFTAKAERWNGRVAMLAFLSLVLIEQFTHSPAFTWF